MQQFHNDGTYTWIQLLIIKIGVFSKNEHCLFVLKHMEKTGKKLERFLKVTNLINLKTF